MSMPSHSDALETRDARYMAMYLGSVVDNDDPLGLNRVRVKVPGICEPKSGWALPIGVMLGVHEGISCRPSVDANVIVFFNQGDTDHPYYLPGPHGAPKGQSDVPPQGLSGNVDVFSFRWRDFHVTMDGREGQAKLTVEDLTSQTKLEIARQTGDFTREVTGSERATIQGDLAETVVGNETHAVTGNRTDTITGNDAKTVGGNETDTITGTKTETVAGAETKTVGLGSTETVGLAKAITAGLNVAITAGGNVAISAGGGVTLLGAGVTSQSTGPATSIAAGLQTNQFLGGISEEVVGAITRDITGDLTESVDGQLTMSATALAKLLSTAVTLGVEATAKRLLTREFLTEIFNVHYHDEVGAAGVPKIRALPQPVTAPDVDEELVLTQNVQAS